MNADINKIIEAATKLFGEDVALRILGFLRSPSLGMFLGAPVSCSAAYKFDMKRCGLVDDAGGLTELGLSISMAIKS